MGLLRRLARGREPVVSCHAPFTSMYLDQRGNVRACCWNDYHVLGNIGERSLTEIWHGESTATLRRAMEAHDLTQGCEFCKWQVDEGRPDLAALRWFEEFPVTAPDPDWPQQLEFSVSNTCNLQCVMCNGEWSSSIRSQREGLAPLPAAYGDDFFADLGAFLPHLRRAKFLGGEPFLAVETLRVMEMMVAAGSTARCHVTTNGTQWTPRVERILDLLPVDVSVSLDAATAETYESIRVGSSWETVRRNLGRFLDHAERNGTQVGLTFCLMTVNWHEFFAYCRLADELGISADVNTVSQPDHLTLFRLEVPELERVVEALNAVDDQEADTLGGSRRSWDAELDKLRRHLGDRRDGRVVTGLDVRRESRVSVRPFERGQQLRRAGRIDELRAQTVDFRDQWVGSSAPRVQVDNTGQITGVDGPGPVLGVEQAELIGRHVGDLFGVFESRLGAIAHVDTETQTDEDRLLRAEFEDGRAVHVLSTVAFDDEGATTGTWLYLAWADGPDPALRDA